MNKSDMKQGAFAGQRAFVCGNGPSLTLEVLDAIKDEYTFGVNQVGIIFDRTDWRPTFYVGITTALFDSRHHDYVMRGINEAKIAFCWDRYGARPETQTEHTIYMPCSRDEDIDYPPELATDDYWSDNPLERLDKFGVSAFAALQVAAWLGFDPIYLIGCDGDYSKPNGKDESHFDADYRAFDVTPHYDYDELNAALLRAHEIAEVNTQRLGIDIINLSMQSVIEAHGRARIEDIL